ncbi:MAG: 50S ribosomal protein L24 [bacterium]|nr:50S ribosomal protein L24 [bacterium]MDA1024561.1 50S ribosomal protein L24 [bacterium]
MKIKVNDNVRVIAGKEKGKTGKVVQVLKDANTVVVEGVNKAVKHLKARGGEKGQRVEFDAPLHVSNVRVIGTDSEGRIGYKFIEKDEKQVKVRVLRTKTGVEDLN